MVAIRQRDAEIAGLVELAVDLRRRGFAWVAPERLAFIRGPAFDELLGEWDQLEPDRYLPDGGGYRCRRHALYHCDLARGLIERQPSGPYYQDRATNPFAGGIEREFAPLGDAAGANPALLALVQANIAMFAAAQPDLEPSRWSADVHLVRITGREEIPGRPSPEGIHHDGFDWVSLHMIDHANVVGGETRLYEGMSPDSIVAQRLLEQLESVYADDRRIRHHTTPIHPKMPGVARRDMLLMSYRRLD